MSTRRGTSEPSRFYRGTPIIRTMWLVEDEHMVHTETYRSPEGMETEISIRFGSSDLFGGRQRYKWKRGWFCAYVVMKDADFDIISGRLTYAGKFP